MWDDDNYERMFERMKSVGKTNTLPVRSKELTAQKSVCTFSNGNVCYWFHLDNTADYCKRLCTSARRRWTAHMLWKARALGFRATPKDLASYEVAADLVEENS